MEKTPEKNKSIKAIDKQTTAYVIYHLLQIYNQKDDILQPSYIYDLIKDKKKD